MWPAASKDIYYLILYERSMPLRPLPLVSNPTLRLLDCSTPGSSDYGILQARILGWVAMPSSRGSS